MENENIDVKESEKSLNAEDNSELESSTNEQIPQEVTDETPAGESEDNKSETAPKKGAENRIRELAAEKNEYKSRAEKAEEKLSSLSQQVGDYTDLLGTGVPYQPSQYAEGSELSPEQYQGDVLRAAEAIVDLKIQRQKHLDRISSESQLAEQAYPQLNPDDRESYDSELSESVTEATMAFIRNNPTGSVKKFVDGLMKPYMRSVQKEVGAQSENLAKQVSQGALRPTSSIRDEKRFEELSIAEMEKKLGKTY